MKRFIVQKDEVCSDCKCELPKGSDVYLGDLDYNNVLCEDCFMKRKLDTTGY